MSQIEKARTVMLRARYKKDVDKPSTHSSIVRCSPPPPRRTSSPSLAIRRLNLVQREKFASFLGDQGNILINVQSPGPASYAITQRDGKFRVVAWSLFHTPEFKEFDELIDAVKEADFQAFAQK